MGPLPDIPKPPSDRSGQDSPFRLTEQDADSVAQEVTMPVHYALRVVGLLCR